MKNIIKSGSIREGDKPVTSGSDVVLESETESVIILRLNAGQYEFTAEMNPATRSLS